MPVISSGNLVTRGGIKSKQRTRDGIFDVQYL